MGCKGSAVLEYPIDDVFNIFIKAAKRDFPNFNEDKAVGCKIEKIMNNFTKLFFCDAEKLCSFQNQSTLIKVSQK